MRTCNDQTKDSATTRRTDPSRLRQCRVRPIDELCSMDWLDCTVAASRKVRRIQQQIAKSYEECYRWYRIVLPCGTPARPDGHVRWRQCGVVRHRAWSVYGGRPVAKECPPDMWNNGPILFTILAKRTWFKRESVDCSLPLSHSDVHSLARSFVHHVINIQMKRLEQLAELVHGYYIIM